MIPAQPAWPHTPADHDPLTDPTLLECQCGYRAPAASAPIWDALIAERGAGLVLAADDVVEAMAPGAGLFQGQRS